MAATASDCVKVTIWGHSFIRRLRDYVTTTHPDHSHNLGITNYPCSITFQGTGGLTVSKARRQLCAIQSTHPDIVVLDLGSNDLCDPFMMVVDLVDSLFQLGQELLESGTRLVYFLPIIPRSRAPDTTYNTRVRDFNSIMKLACANHNHFHFWVS